MNVRMMPQPGPMGQPMPQGGAPAPMGPMGGPPPPMPQPSNQSKGLGSTFGGNAAGRGQFRQFMSSKKQMAPPMMPPSVAPMAIPTSGRAPQGLPMLPPPMPTNMGAMKPMGAPNMGGSPRLGRQAPVGGGIGSAPMGVGPNANAVRGFADGGSVPRRTNIYGVPHELSYINAEERDLLKGLGGMGTPGPGGVPQYNAISDFFSGFANDLSMGLGFKEKDQDFVDRTAQNIASDPNRGSSDASKYAAGMTDSGFDDNFNVVNNSQDEEDDETVQTDYSNSGSFGDAFSTARDNLGAGNTFTYNGQEYSTAIAGEDPDLDAAIAANANTNTGTVNVTKMDFDDDEDYTPTSAELNAQLAANNQVNLTDDQYAQPVDFTTTASGQDYTTAAEADTDVSGFEFVADTDSDTGVNLAGSTLASDEPITLAPVVPDPVVVVPDPVFYDMFGREHKTQESANAEDKNYIDSQQQAIDIASMSDGVAGYTLGGNQFAGPDLPPVDQDIDSGPTQYEIDASNNTARLMNDYSVIGDDYSTFQGNDLTTEDGNTIGYATGGSKVGYSAVINPSTGGIDILTPGSESIERSFAATELEDALNFLTDGDIDLTKLDAPLDLLPEYSGGTGTVGLDSEGRLIQYGIDDIDDMIDSIENVSSMTDAELAALAGDDTEFFEDGTPTSAQLEAQLAEQGLTNITTGPLSVEDQIAQYDTGVNLDTLDAQRQESDDISADLAMEGLLNTGALDDTILDPKTFDLTDNEALKNSDGTKFTGQYRGTSYVDGQPVNSGTDVTSDGTTASTSGTTDATGSESYLSAVTKISDPNYDPNESTLTNAEQYALYGARGQTPNAAEAAYLNDLLSDATHKEDVVNPDTGEVIAKAGDKVTAQSFGEKVEDGIVTFIDMFLNPLSIFGDKFTIGGTNAANVEAQLEAYKNGGTFIYGEDGKTVVGVAEPNFDASGDGNNDTVVLFDGDGNKTVTGDAIAVIDVENSNNNTDGEEFDIDIVDSDKTYTNTEDGVVEELVGAVEEETSDDTFVDPCPEGFYLDPITQECTPLDGVEGGLSNEIKLKLDDIIRTPGGEDVVTPVAPNVAGLKIKGPKQFAAGGMVTPNISRFVQSLGM